MARLTTQDYLTTRRFLAKAWAQDAGSSFAVLPTTAQHDIHDFYAPSVSMEESEALAHRKAMTAAFPSLPHSAGRAVVAFRASLDGEPNQLLDRDRVRTATKLNNGRRTRTLRVRPVVKPQLDEYRLVKLIECLWREDDNDVSRRPKN